MKRVKVEKRKDNRGGARPGAGRKTPGQGREKGSTPYSIATPRQKINMAAEARKYTELSITTLAEICKDGESEGSRISAAVHLLDRGYGKPAQGVRVTGADDGPMMLQLDQTQLRFLPEPILMALEMLVGSLSKTGSLPMLEHEPEVSADDYAQSVN